MVADLRFIIRDEKKVLQWLGPAKISGTSPDGYLNYSVRDMQWQDVRLEADDEVVHLEIAS